jgi:copper homeostasis protein
MDPRHPRDALPQRSGPFRRMCDDAAVPESILEVIALDAADARAARDGGADRIELVADMRRQGLTPAVATFAAVREAVGIPVRVMLRADDGYALSEADAVVSAATALRAAGADEFVLGFLDARGAVDLPAVEAVLHAIEGCPWTFHRAIDHAADRAAARDALATLPGLDCVLTAGGPATVSAGTTCRRCWPPGWTRSTPAARCGRTGAGMRRWTPAWSGPGARPYPDPCLRSGR